MTDDIKPQHDLDTQRKLGYAWITERGREELARLSLIRNIRRVIKQREVEPIGR